MRTRLDNQLRELNDDIIRLGGQCEKACPQHLPIREYLLDVAAKFETGSSFPMRK